MRLMNLGLTALDYEMATTDVTDVPDIAGDTFLHDTLKAAETPRHAAARKVGGVVPVRRSQFWTAARLANPRDEITQETPFEAEVVAAPVPTAPVALIVLPPAVIGITDFQLDVRASAIKNFGRSILMYFGHTTGMYGKPIEQKPTQKKLKVDLQTGQLVTSKNPATGETVDFEVFIDPFHNRVILDPTQKSQFAEKFRMANLSHRHMAYGSPDHMLIDEFFIIKRKLFLYRAILSLDGMAILGHPADAVDPALPEANPEKLTSVNKATLKILVPAESAITVSLSDASMATGMMGAKKTRLYFAPDGSICRANYETASLEWTTPYSKGLAESPHYVDVAMTENTLLAHGELSHLTPRQITAFLALYQDSEMANQREVVEKEFPGLGQRVMTKAVD